MSVVSLLWPIVIAYGTCTSTESSHSSMYSFFPVTNSLRSNARWWAAVRVAFTGLLLVAVGVASTVSLAVSTLVFLLLLMLKIVLELLVAPYKARMELHARVLS